MTYSFHINGHPVEIGSAAMTALLEVLRDELGLRGAKPGCGEGRCGACTVLVDDVPVASCLYPVALAESRHVRTVEGLAAPDGPLTPVQEALLEHGGVQCGACIPGVVMTLTAVLERTPRPTPDQIRDALVGNICRCTGYHKIVEAAVAVGRGEEG
jgi:aerobic-type carbon monoxide dehydrogenase small subunit (CoxS/CutS family)